MVRVFIVALRWVTLTRCTKRSSGIKCDRNLSVWHLWTSKPNPFNDCKFIRPGLALLGFNCLIYNALSCHHFYTLVLLGFFFRIICAAFGFWSWCALDAKCVYWIFSKSDWCEIQRTRFSFGQNNLRKCLFCLHLWNRFNLQYWSLGEQWTVCFENVYQRGETEGIVIEITQNHMF